MHSAVFEAADEDRQSEDEQRVREDRSDQRALDDRHQPGAQRERAHEQFREIAERRLENAGRGRAEVGAELLGPARHVHGEQRQSRRGRDEAQHVVRAGNAQDRGHDDRGHGGADDDAVLSCEHAPM